MRSKVSARQRAALPLSLMVRLERMAQGQGWQAAGEGLEDIQHDPDVEPRGTWAFGLGAFAGVVLVGAAFLGVAVAFELQTPPRNPRLSAANPPPANAAQPVAVPAAKAAQPVVFEVAVERARAAHVPFGLHLTGSDTSGIEVVLSNVPPAASLSHGQRRGESTWTVQAAELGQLHLALRDGTPETFEVRIDVLAPPSMAVVPSIAKVRLIGAAPTAPAPTAIAETQLETPVRDPVNVAAAPEPPAPTPKAETSNAPQSKSAEATKPAAPQPKRPPPVVAQAGSAGKQGAPTPPPWTEIPSALGATSRGGEWDRQVWWQLPLPFWPPVVEAPPAWSPFLDPPAHR